jgi:hypothetical protein
MWRNGMAKQASVIVSNNGENLWRNNGISVNGENKHSKMKERKRKWRNVNWRKAAKWRGQLASAVAAASLNHL